MTDIHRFIVLGQRPWAEFNEYEGELEVICGAFAPEVFTVYALLDSAAAWRTTGTEFFADLFLLRCGNVTRAPAGTTASVQHIDGSSNCDAIGVVRRIGTNEVWLDVGHGFLLRVDLDPAPTIDLPDFGIGDCAKIRGRLEVDIC